MRDGRAFLRHKRLEGVAEGVAEIQDAPHAAVARVAATDGSLEVRRVADKRRRGCHVGQRRVPGDSGEGVATQQLTFEELEAAAEPLVVRQRVEKRRMDAHRHRRIEEAHLVLYTLQVDGRLATHGGIDHGQQRGGNVDVAYATLVAGGDETAEVADTAATQVDDDAVGVGTAVQQRRPHLLGNGETLRLLADRQLDELGLLQRRHRRHERGQTVGEGVGIDEEEVAGVAEGGALQHTSQPRQSGTAGGEEDSRGGHGN